MKSLTCKVFQTIEQRQTAILIISFLFILGGNNFVQATGLVDVYQMAIANDPVFQGAGFEQEAIKERRNQAIAEFLPTIEGSADYTHTYQDIKSADNTVVAEGDIDYGSTTFGLKLTQPIFHWDDIVGLDKNESEILQAEKEYLLASHDLIIRVAERYFEALGAQDQRDFVLAEQAAVDKHYELASERFDMGLIAVTDLHDAKARKAAVLAKSIEAQNILDDAMQALEEVTGQIVLELSPLKDDVDIVSPDPVDIDAWLKMAMENNPAIELQTHSVEVSRLDVEQQTAGHYPTVDLVGSIESKDTDGSLYGGGNDGEIADVMVVLNVPFYAGGSVSSKVREAKHFYSKSKQDLVRQQRAVARQTRAAYLGVTSAVQQIEALHESVVSNQLALEAKQEGFLSGLYTSLNVLDAERDLSFANIDYARARYDYFLNNLKLKQAVGSLTEQDIFLLEQVLAINVNK